jgi:hypothetical protein
MRWETRIEPFYDPHTTRMWIRGVSSASWYDVMGELKTIEFTQWLTDLTYADVQKILKRQEAQQGALDEQALAEAQDLLDQILKAGQSADYDNMIILFRELTEQYSTSKAANTARYAVSKLPQEVQEKHNITSAETKPVTPSVSDSSGTSSDTQSSSNESDNNPTPTDYSTKKVYLDYTEADLDKIFQDNPQEFWRIIMEMLNGKK